MSRDKTITQLTELSSADLASADSFPVYDASASGVRTKKVTGEGLAGALMRLMGMRSVTDPAYGAEGDNTTDDSSAIDTADAAVATGGQLWFPRGQYKVEAAITKAGFSDWVAARGTAPPASTNFGAVLVAGYDGALVKWPTAGSEYATYAGIRGMSFYSPGLDTYAAARAIQSNGNTRQVAIEDAVIDGFHIGVYGPLAEWYFKRVFFFNGKYGIFGFGCSDSWFEHCHAGSGTAADAGASGGAGFFFANSNSLHLLQCRGQVQDGGSGTDIRSSSRITLVDHIGDANETYGLHLINSHRIEVTGGQFYENGTTAANGKGIRLEAISDTFTADASTDEITITNGNTTNYWGANHQVVEFSNSGGALPAGLSASTEYFLIAGSAAGKFQVATSYANAVAETAVDITDAGTGTHSILGVVRDITIRGAKIFDRNKGLADEKQDVGIQFVKTALNSAADGKIRNITIESCDFTGVTTPLEFTDNVDSELRILNCSGIRGESLAGSSTQTFRVGVNAPIQHFNSALAGDIDITLSQDGAYSGATFTISRGVSATGAFAINVKNSNGSTMHSIALDASNVQSARFVYFAGATNQWLPVKDAGY